jgi:hypothetical protein
MGPIVIFWVVFGLAATLGMQVRPDTILLLLETVWALLTFPIVPDFLLPEPSSVG